MISTLRSIIAKKSDDGASAVEYGLLVAAIAAIIVIVVFALGGWVNGAFEKTCTDIETNAEGVTSTSDAACP